MRSYHDLHMPVLRGRDHLDRRLAGLLPLHATFLLLDVFQTDVSEAENVLALREAAAQAPRHLQTMMPCGPNHAMLLLAATPKYARQALDYAVNLAGDGNFVVFQDGHVRDRRGQVMACQALDADCIDLWAGHLGIDLRADGLFDRSISFVRYAAAVGLP